MEKILVSWKEFEDMISKITKDIQESKEKFDNIFGIPRGGLPIAVRLSHKLNIPLTNKPTKKSLIVDDISDNGITLKKFSNQKIATLFTTPWTKIKPDWYAKEKKSQSHWIIFPWEA